MIRAQSVEVDILRQSSIKAQFVGVDDLRRSSIKAQSVGVDAHIDPRAAENQPGSPVGELSAKLTEGFCKESA